MDLELDVAHILIFMKYSFENKITKKRKRKSKSKQTVDSEVPKQCQICHTKISPLWRKLPEYTCVCNRCGLKHKRK
jgi:hypothetical protein